MGWRKPKTVNTSRKDVIVVCIVMESYSSPWWLLGRISKDWVFTKYVVYFQNLRHVWSCGGTVYVLIFCSETRVFTLKFRHWFHSSPPWPWSHVISFKRVGYHPYHVREGFCFGSRQPARSLWGGRKLRFFWTGDFWPFWSSTYGLCKITLCESVRGVKPLNTYNVSWSYLFSVIFLLQTLA